MWASVGHTQIWAWDERMLEVNKRPSVYNGKGRRANVMVLGRVRQRKIETNKLMNIRCFLCTVRGRGTAKWSGGRRVGLSERQQGN